jgi:hypothetical protein
MEKSDCRKRYRNRLLFKKKKDKSQEKNQSESIFIGRNKSGLLPFVIVLYDFNQNN